VTRDRRPARSNAVYDALVTLRRKLVTTDFYKKVLESVMLDMTLTDAERSLLMYLAPHKPGFVFYEDWVVKKTGRSTNWARMTMRSLRSKGYLQESRPVRNRDGTFGQWGSTLNVNTVVASTEAEFPQVTSSDRFHHRVDEPPGGKTTPHNQDEVLDNHNETSSQSMEFPTTGHPTTVDKNRSPSSATEPCLTEGTVDDGQDKTSRGSPGTNARGRPHARTRETRRGIHDLTDIDHWWYCKPCRQEIERRREEDFAAWEAMSDAERREYFDRAWADRP
jgi:hypothetical protein